VLFKFQSKHKPEIQIPGNLYNKKYLICKLCISAVKLEKVVQEGLFMVSSI